jgi:hypothetical protein
VDNQLWSFFPLPLTRHISFSVCLVFVAVDPLWHCITGSPIYKHAISLFIFLLVASVLGFIYATIFISCISFQVSELYVIRVTVHFGNDFFEDLACFKSFPNQSG